METAWVPIDDTWQSSTLNLYLQKPSIFKIPKQVANNFITEGYLNVASNTFRPDLNFNLKFKVFKPTPIG